MPTATTHTTRLDRMTGRLPRLLSIEQEVASNPGIDHAAEALYEAGLTGDRGVDSYSRSGSRDYLALVKSDSSCGGEIVYSYLDLRSRQASASLDRALAVLAELKRDGLVRFSLQAGLHTHVGLDGPGGVYTPQQAASLYHLWNYLEEPLYRIAAAGWSQHRSDNGSPYCPPTPKGHRGTVDILGGMGRNRNGLNLTNYIAALSSCTCEALRFGAFNECTCSLRKCTAEFRVWNTTGNPRKFRAYSALSLAMVDAAARHTFTADTHPPSPFAHSRRPNRSHGAPEATNTTPGDYLSRCRFILGGGLPLGPTEKEAVAYCILHSDLPARIADEDATAALLDLAATNATEPDADPGDLLSRPDDEDEDDDDDDDDDDDEASYDNREDW